MTDDTLIYYGGDVKALGSGRVGGYLVRFGGPESADVQGDFFTSDTYFGRAVKSGIDVVYHHGVGRIDPLAVRLGNAVIGEGTVETKADGLWIESQINEPEVYTKAERGELGWSSGSVDRLIRREAVKGNITRITQWPMIEASLSPRPVDPRNKAFALKALMEASDDQGTGSGTLVERALALVSSAKALASEFGNVASAHDLNATKREAIKAAAEGFARLYDATAPRPDPEQVQALKKRLLLARLGT